jgi:hypothetical protein
MEQFLIQILKFYNSGTFSVIKFFLAVYITILFVDVVLLLILRGLGADIRKTIKGITMPAMPGRLMKNKWLKIRSRLESPEASQWKAAILEADALIDKVLASMGYAGKNLTERLEKIKPVQLPDYEGLKKAHQIRNKIVQDKEFFVEKEKAEEILEIYAGILRNLEIL